MTWFFKQVQQWHLKSLELRDEKGVTSNRYSHLLSPIKIGNVILKNRMIHSRSLPHFLQGPETFPSEAVISHYAGVARNGAAIVTVKGGKAT